MRIKELPNLTIEAYLAGEQDGEVRHEYVDGRIYAMTGASARHNLLAGNIFSSLHGKARAPGCQVFMADMKVHIAQWNAFYYPDVMLCCDQNDKEDYFREHPCLIVEVLSPATAGIDRREKLAAYQTLASLKEYVVIEQERVAVEVYRRTQDAWVLEELDIDDVLHFECLNFDFEIRELYEGVALKAEG
jgi:Uma2 family endonuclease